MLRMTRHIVGTTAFTAHKTVHTGQMTELLYFSFGHIIVSIYMFVFFLLFWPLIWLSVLLNKSDEIILISTFEFDSLHIIVINGIKIKMISQWVTEQVTEISHL